MRREEIVRLAQEMGDVTMGQGTRLGRRPSGLRSLGARPSGTGRRQGWKTMHPAMYVLTHCWTGLALGAAAAVLVFAAVRLGAPPLKGRIPELALLSGAIAFALMGIITWQMRVIRATTFTARAKGETREFRIRRRGEVLRKILLRGAGTLVLAAVLFAALHGGITYYRQVIVARHTFRLTVPTVGADLVFVGIALALALATLVPIEAVLRLTRKAGYPMQGASLFVPANLAFTAILYVLPSL